MKNTHFAHFLLSVLGGFLLLLILSLTLPYSGARALAPSPGGSMVSPEGGGPAGVCGALPAAPGRSGTVFLPTVIDHSLASYNPCGPGRTIFDPSNDVSIAHIDVLKLDSSLKGESLQAIFSIRDVPAQLTFNRLGVPRNRLEYGWSIEIDVDNNPETGSSVGTEYELSAKHYIFQPDTPVVLPIEQGVQVNTWYYDATSDSWRYLAPATLVVDAAEDTMALTGDIPGIQTGSRLYFQTTDDNPGGSRQYDMSSCSPAVDLRTMWESLGASPGLDGIIRQWSFLEIR